MFALGLYAGEGDKTAATWRWRTRIPLYLRVFLTWLRRTFEIDESRLRVVLYLHEGLDLDAATAFWSRTARASRASSSRSRIGRSPTSRSAAPSTSMGVARCAYCGHVDEATCDGDDRSGIVCDRRSGIAQLAERRAVNAMVAGSSPAPGATKRGPQCGTLLCVFGVVAQWSEQGTHNPWVVGSIPTRPTRSERYRAVVRCRSDAEALVQANVAETINPGRVAQRTNNTRMWRRRCMCEVTLSNAR